MEPISKNADVGVIVGRFQLHELHPGHKELIDYVCKRHRKVVVVLGVAPVFSSANPLDIHSRSQMLQDYNPSLIITYIKDTRSDEKWSKDLDDKVSDYILPGQSALIYGARDSFIQYYTGSYDTQELKGDMEAWSATGIRNNIRLTTLPTADFRAGAIYSRSNDYPRAIATVDVACLDNQKKNVVIVKKADESLWRFPGGFCEPDSLSYEEDAQRELYEETGLMDIAPLFSGGPKLHYIGSKNIDDWRYRRTKDRIRTSLFVTQTPWGTPSPADDVAHAKFYPVSDLNRSMFVEEHRSLFDIFKEFCHNNFSESV